MEKRCPTCDRKYVEKDLNYCLADGSFLLTPDEFQHNQSALPASPSAEPTAVFTNPQPGRQTHVTPAGEAKWSSDTRPQASTPLPAATNKSLPRLLAVGGVLALLLVAGLVGLFFLIKPFSSPADNLNRRGNASPATNRNTRTADSSSPTYASAEDADARIQRDVQRAIENASELRGQNIGVSVEGGTVILTGSVSTVEQKNRAEAIAKRIKGVKNIENQISVDS